MVGTWTHLDILFVTNIIILDGLTLVSTPFLVHYCGDLITHKYIGNLKILFLIQVIMLILGLIVYINIFLRWWRETSTDIWNREI